MKLVYDKLGINNCGLPSFQCGAADLIEVAGEKYNAVLQDTQFNPVSDALAHADFLLAPAGKPVTVNIPVETEGLAPGVVAGGALQTILRKLTVNGAADAIPEARIKEILTINSLNLFITSPVY